MLWIRVTTKTAKSPTINRSHHPPRNYPKLLSSREPLATPPRNEPPNLTLLFSFLALNNQESRIKKKCQKSGNDHESHGQIVDPFSQF